MRLAPIAAAAAAFAMLAPIAAHAAEPNPSEVTDIRCLVVGGALVGSSDPDVQSLGRATLFYFLGRIDGRGRAPNLTARVADVYGKMSAADIQAQIPVCSALFTAANQSLQDISGVLKDHAGVPPK